MNGIFEAATAECERVLESSKGAGLTEDQILEAFKRTVADQLAAVDSWDDLKPAKAVRDRIFPKITSIVEQAGPHIFGELLPHLKEDLVRAAKALFARSFFPGPSSGVVIAGYGDDEIFPGLATFDFDGAVRGFVRFKVDEARTRRVSANNSSAIVAFAQDDMVATFMEGINPSVNKYLEHAFREVFTELPKTLGAEIKPTDAKLVEKLDAVCTKIEERFVNEARMYRYHEHVMPVLHMVNALPKDELAAMAESLVNLTAFKRKVTGTLETVGGPIDVCVISKGDGLVWVKRKHYFPGELNLLFQKNYLREVGDGQEAKK